MIPQLTGSGSRSRPWRQPSASPRSPGSSSSRLATTGRRRSAPTRSRCWLAARSKTGLRPSARRPARATDAWAAVRGADAEIAVAALTLLSAAAARRAGHPDAAADHAAEGLARLDDLRPGASAPHLAAALAAEWITRARRGGPCGGCAARPAPRRPSTWFRRRGPPDRSPCCGSPWRGRWPSRPRRARSRLSNRPRPTLPPATHLISKGLCLSTLGTLREQAGRLDAALESMRRGVAAQRRDRARSERFRAALRALPLPSGATAPVGATGRQDSPLPSPAVRRRSPRGQGGRHGPTASVRGEPVDDRSLDEPVVRDRRRAGPADAAVAPCGQSPSGPAGSTAGRRSRDVEGGSAASAGATVRSPTSRAPTGQRRRRRRVRPAVRAARRDRASRSSWASPQARPRATEVAGPAPSAAAGEAVKVHDERELAGEPRSPSWIACVGRTAARARAHGRPGGEGRARSEPSAAPSRRRSTSRQPRVAVARRRR